jgi:hypothetical protein
MFARRLLREREACEEKGKQREVSEAMQECDQQWHRRSEDVLVGMKEWRQQHPRATVTDIEAALDERVER